MIHFTITISRDVVFAGIGYIAGAFTPAIGRKIKALFVKDSKAVVADVKKAV